MLDLVALEQLAAEQLAVLVVDLVSVVVDLVAYKAPHPTYLKSMTQPPLIIKLALVLMKGDFY